MPRFPGAEFLHGSFVCKRIKPVVAGYNMIQHCNIKQRVPQSLIFLVILISASLDVTVPEGWLCLRMIDVACSSKQFRKIFRINNGPGNPTLRNLHFLKYPVCPVQPKGPNPSWGKSNMRKLKISKASWLREILFLTITTEGRPLQFYSWKRIFRR